MKERVASCLRGPFGSVEKSGENAAPALAPQSNSNTLVSLFFFPPPFFLTLSTFVLWCDLSSEGEPTDVEKDKSSVK